MQFVRPADGSTAFTFRCRSFFKDRDMYGIYAQHVDGSESVLLKDGAIPTVASSRGQRSRDAKGGLYA